MKKFSTIILLFTVLFAVSCKMQRAPIPGFGFSFGRKEVDENSLEYQLEMALLIDDDQERYDRVEELLKQGADPDRKTGQFEWLDTNPLWGCCRRERLSKLLISYDADVKKRPYVAQALTGRVIANKNPREDWVEFSKKVLIRTEDDAYKACRVLLEAGADPNMKVFGGAKILLIPTDKNYNKFFEKNGDSAINACIEMNLLTVFELLVSYNAMLDEKSLALAKENAERTGSTEMQDLVLAQWERQNK